MPDALDKRLAQSVELGTLCACYGGLLTEKQRTALRLHCDEDFSLAEIADELGVSRQNVHELITRSEQKLRRYEAALHLAEQSTKTVAALRQALEALQNGRTADCEQQLQALIFSLDGEEDEAHGV